MSNDAGSPSLGRLILTGYGNAEPEIFFAALAVESPQEAVDIRLKPWGWHADYRGEAFLAALRERAGVTDARHDPRLGNPGRFDEGGMRLADEKGLNDIWRALRAGHDVAVICGCGKLAGCHRRLIAERLTAVLPELEIVDLPAPTRPRKPKPSPESADDAKSTL